MTLEPVQLTQELVDIKSVSRWSNLEISALVEERMVKNGFEAERLEYVDENGEKKASIVGRKGKGTGGLAFFSHTDTVPGQEQDWDAFSSTVKDGRIIGRGSCDMKGPLAATMVAAAQCDASRLKRPVLVMATADEEVGGQGVKQVVDESHLLRTTQPEFGVVAEPTRLIPVYSHKGGAQVFVTAHGKAAHTSMDLGISANFIIAPFLAEMADLAKKVRIDERFMNHDFTPPTNGFNMVMDDGGTKQNVTAAKTVCQVCFRPMPGDKSTELLELIIEKAKQHGLEVQSRVGMPYYISPEASIVRLACEVTGVKEPQTVPFGTDAVRIGDALDLVVLGPGSIAQAHTVGEWIAVDQLHEAVRVYTDMIEHACM